jgi:hypothetical protein
VRYFGYEELLTKIGANQDRLNKLVIDLSTFNDLYSILREDVLASNRLAIKPGTEGYWQRVFSAARKVAHHIYDTPDCKHPLIYEDDTNKDKKWITSADLEYKRLIMIYALVRLAWEKNVLIIGLIKDTAAAELTKMIVPILQNAQKFNILGVEGAAGKLPNFNTDTQLLQTSSAINGEFVINPWRTFEFDSCFRTIAPIVDNEAASKNNQSRVRGAFKNVISAERIFVKFYIQLWQSENGHIELLSERLLPILTESD